MKFFRALVISTLVGLTIFLNGCTKTEIIYKYPEIPNLISKPQAQDYNVSMAEINNINYYVLTEEDAKILSENWIRYKAYAEANEELLETIKNYNANKTKEDK